MRRRLEVFIPIVLFSIMVQLLAPIGAFRAVAHAVSDPLYMATICSGMASSPDVSQATGAKPQHGANCCGFCGVSHGGAVAVDPPPLIFVVLQRQYRLVAWLQATDQMPRGARRLARAGPRATLHFLTRLISVKWCGPRPRQSVPSRTAGHKSRRQDHSCFVLHHPPGSCAARCWRRPPIRFPLSAEAQSERQSLPPVTVTAPEQKRAATARPAQQSRPAARATRVVPVRNPAPASTPQATGLETPKGGSLTVPATAQARALIERTPGGVALVPDTAFKSGPANTIKDILGWVPGVIAQTRWGPDGRISIRGSGLTRSFGNRGINLYMDGIPINTADGLADLFEVDPTAYRYVEVYKGANALRYGANSLGGAINFVTPTGRDASPFEARVDAGSFGYLKSQVSTGGVNGPYDWFVSGSAQREDGYRQHSRNNVERLNANVGYQFSPDAETRFYLNANSVARCNCLAS